jgi:hypothetical protein
MCECAHRRRSVGSLSALFASHHVRVRLLLSRSRKQHKAGDTPSSRTSCRDRAPTTVQTPAYCKSVELSEDIKRVPRTARSFYFRSRSLRRCRHTKQRKNRLFASSRGIQQQKTIHNNGPSLKVREDTHGVTSSRDQGSRRRRIRLMSRLKERSS